MRKSDKNSDWRGIHQQLFSPAITPAGRRRRRFATLKRLGLIFGSIALLLGLGAVALYIRANSQTFAPYAQQNHRTQIEFFSDGQLKFSSFEEKFPGLRTKGLLTIDIAQLQNEILKNPQVLAAVVERQFPSTLKITLRERRAIARIKLKTEGKAQTFYLSAGGEFFLAENYKAPNTLPYISKANIKLKGQNIAPVGGAELISEVLEGLEERFGVYNALVKSIDLSQWAYPPTPQTALNLNLRNGSHLRFGAKNIPTQLNRLGEVIVLLEQERDSLSHKFIDLTYPDKVAIVGLP